MTNEIKISQGILSETDIDVLSGMMIIFLHAAEKCIRTMELHYEAEYRAGNDYKKLCKMYGKPQADRILREQTRKVIRGDERNKLGKILRVAEDFHKHMESLTESGMKSHRQDTTDCDAFDAIQHDTNFLCYLYALMGNCIGADDELKIISATKALAKGDRVSENVLEKMKMQ